MDGVQAFTLNRNTVLLHMKVKRERKPNPFANVNPISTLEYYRAHARAHTLTYAKPEDDFYTLQLAWQVLAATHVVSAFEADPGTGAHEEILPPSICDTHWILDYVEVASPNSDSRLGIHVYWDAYSAWEQWDYMTEADETLDANELGFG